MMKNILTAFAALLMISSFASEIDVDGKFENFSRSWRLSSRRMGTVELVPSAEGNFVHIAADEGPRDSIGIYNARSISAGRGDTVSVQLDVKGGDFEISLYEYSKKKFAGIQTKKFKASQTHKSFKTSFIVSKPNTDIVRVALNVKKGGCIIVSNVKICMQAAAGEKTE